MTAVGVCTLAPGNMAKAVAAGQDYNAWLNHWVTGAGQSISTTWNPADKSANISLIGGNLVAQSTTVSDGGVRSTSSAKPSKFYFETVWSNTSGGGDTGCGIATAAAVLSAIGAAAANAVLVFTSGNIYVNGASSGVTISMGVAPRTICVAGNLTTSRIWFRSGNGNWNGNASFDPATNTGGVDISALFPANPAYAVMALNGSNTPTYTINFGATAFAQAVPSGFAAFG